MRICDYGLNYKSASIEIRESLAFSPQELTFTLNNWSDHFVGCEMVLLSTCNRTEIYIASDNDDLPAVEQVIGYLLKQKMLFATLSPNMLSSAVLLSDLRRDDVVCDSFCASDVIRFLPHFFSFFGQDAVEHLFSVTAGLDSMLLGEVQIPAQVKAAYQAAYNSDTVGAVLNRLFQFAFKTAKQITNETELHKHRLSLPGIAVVDFALQIFERLDNKKILVLGAGEMGRETLMYLREHGAKNITVANRSIDNAELLAKEFNGKTASWEERFNLMTEADLIVSATGSKEPVVRLSDFRRIEQLRKKRTLFILDLAVPRDFEPEIGNAGNVYLYSIDDLQETCNRNRIEREREIPKAARIIERGASDFMQWINHRTSSVVIQKLREHLTKVGASEVERLFNKLPELNERERSEIQYSFDRLIAKILHLPLSSLHEESTNGHPHNLLQALAHLFRLK
jgi:glutamyl-tRNA reductase